MKVESSDRKREKSNHSLGSNCSGDLKNISPNCFINFLREFIAENKSKVKKYNLVFKLAGDKWRNMNHEERFPYMEAANRKKAALHRRDFSVAYKLNRGSRCFVCGHRHGSTLKPRKFKKSKSPDPRVYVRESPSGRRKRSSEQIGDQPTT